MVGGKRKNLPARRHRRLWRTPYGVLALRKEQLGGRRQAFITGDMATQIGRFANLAEIDREIGGVAFAPVALGWESVQLESVRRMLRFVILLAVVAAIVEAIRRGSARGRRRPPLPTVDAARSRASRRSGRDGRPDRAHPRPRTRPRLRPPPRLQMQLRIRPGFARRCRHRLGRSRHRRLVPDRLPAQGQATLQDRPRARRALLRAHPRRPLLRRPGRRRGRRVAPPSAEPLTTRSDRLITWADDRCRSACGRS